MLQRTSVRTQLPAAGPPARLARAPRGLPPAGSSPLPAEAAPRPGVALTEEAVFQQWLANLLPATAAVLARLGRATAYQLPAYRAFCQQGRLARRPAHSPAADGWGMMQDQRAGFC